MLLCMHHCIGASFTILLCFFDFILFNIYDFSFRDGKFAFDIHERTGDKIVEFLNE